jgi:citrate synthase
MNDPGYLSAKEVAEILGISPATVYAYVSRGLIRSESLGGGTRKRRYHREDVERLKRRQAQRNDPEAITETALHFGAPLLDSQLTLIADGRLYYRGLDALALAQEQDLESLARLFWTGDIDADIDFRGPALDEDLRRSASGLESAQFIEQFLALLPRAAINDLRAFDLHPASVIQTGASVLRLLVGVATRQAVIDQGIAAMLVSAWTSGSAAEARLINMALILCVDHELNVSSFTARCIASAGSTPYAAVIGGLAALQGTRHGGSTERVQAMLREIGDDNVRVALAKRLRRGESLPGFGHKLYPDGDPRARLLLDSLAAAFPNSETLAFGSAVCAAAKELTGQEVNIDFGLVMLADMLELPDGAALALFAIGRTVGWIGHVLEQYGEDRLIRPRARYTGRLPGD